MNLKRRYLKSIILALSVLLIICKTAEPEEPDVCITEISRFLSERTSPTCSVCRGKISGKYIEAQGMTIHPDCFVCSECKTRITRAYKIQDGKFYHSDCFKKIKGYYCDYCGKILGDTWNTYNDKKYHPLCFREHVQPRCSICNLSISGEYTTDDHGIYHLACYKLKKLPSCSVCRKPIEGDYIEDPWGNISHQFHDGKSVDICSSCSRIMSTNTSGHVFKYADNRLVCEYCRKTGVFDEHTKDRYLKQSKDLLTAIGLTDFPDDIYIELIDQLKMKKKAGNKFNKKTKGVTHSHVKTIGPLKIASMHTIYILYGLPETEFYGVLTHELIHVWLSDHHIQMPDEELEGFCNLGAREVYVKDDSPLAQVLLFNMERDEDPVYGNGYREMVKALKEKGWDQMIKEIQGND